MSATTQGRRDRRLPLLAGAALLAVGFAWVFDVRGYLHAAPEPVAGIVAERSLLFQDRDDGSVVVTDARDGRLIDRVAPETNGFLRATLRGLANERKRVHGESDPTFHLTRWDNGRLTIDDPVTGRLIELEAFGRTNEMAFARLLMLPGQAP